MKMRINKKKLESLPPVTRQTDIYDEGQRGLVLRLNPSGNHAYYLRWRIMGDVQRVKIAALHELSIEDARGKATEMITRIGKGEDPRTDKEKLPTLRAYLDDTYLPWAMKHIKRAEEQITTIKKHFKPLLGKRVDAISPQDIERIVNAMVKAGKKPGTTNRSCAYLKAAYNRGQKLGAIPKNVNPVTDIQFLREPREKVRYLSADERKRLHEAMQARLQEMQQARTSHNQWLRDRHQPERGELDIDALTLAVTVSLGTGLRQGELMSLQWGEVDFERSEIEVLATRSKSGVGRFVPMPNSVRDALKRWRRQSAPGERFLFPNADGHILNMNKSWRELLKRAQITNFRWHDLRHDYASTLVMRGTDIYSVSRLLGHSSIKVTERYSHLSPGHLREAVRVLDIEPENIVAFAESQAE